MNGFLKTAFIVSAKCEKELYLLGYSLGSLRDFKSFSPMDNIRYLFFMLHEDSPPSLICSLPTFLINSMSLILWSKTKTG